MKTYIVTGCAGMIGWRVTELLISNGANVLGIDDLNQAYDNRIKIWRLSELKKHPGFEFYESDITQLETLNAILDKQSKAKSFDGLIHLAARAGVRQSILDPRDYYSVNLNGTLNLLEACKDLNIAKFVLASTSSIYGDGTSSLSSDNRLSEDLRTDSPISPYAASKKAAEVCAYTFHHLYGIDVSVLRYFTVYGPAGRPDMSLFRFVQKIYEGWPITVYGDGTQSRDFTYVDDIARGTVASLKRLDFEIINLGSGIPIVLLDAIKTIESVIGKKAVITNEPAHPTDVKETWADNSKSQVILNRSPQVSFENGIKELVDWYQKNQTWARELNSVS